MTATAVAAISLVGVLLAMRSSMRDPVAANVERHAPRSLSDLAGTRWIGEALLAEELTPTIESGKVSVEFVERQAVVGSRVDVVTLVIVRTPCTEFKARVDQNGTTLTFSHIEEATKSCEPGDDWLTQAVRWVLEGTKSAELDGDSLLLVSRNDDLLLRFEPPGRLGPPGCDAC